MGKPQKTIVAVTCHVNKWGAERSLCAALAELKRRGFRVVLIIHKHGAIEDLLRENSIEYYVSHINHACYLENGDTGLYWRLRYFVRYYVLKHRYKNAIQNLLREKGISPDIVYSNTIVPETGDSLAKAYKIPHIVHIREITDSDFPFIFYIGKKRYLRIINKRLKYAICISEAVRNKFAPLFKSKAVLIYNGLPIRHYEGKQFSHKDSKTHIVFVGRLSTEKGVMTVVRVMQKIYEGGITNIELDIWGSGVLEKEIRAYMFENNLMDIIHLCGYGENINLSQYDIAVMSSPAEAFGRTTVEYMMAGLPVIGYNGGATPELLLDKQCGLLYNTEEEMLQCLMELIHNKELAHEIGENAHKRAISFFNEEKYLNSICDLFEKI